MVEEKCYNDIFRIPNPFIVEYLTHDLDELQWTINEKEPKFNENNFKLIENMITCNKSKIKTTFPWQTYKVKWNLCLQHNL
jgi:hypothetical protein